MRAVPRRLILAALCLLSLSRPAELPRDVALLRDVKHRMSQNLARIPNYTCLETIVRGTRPSERYVIAAPGRQVPFRKVDIVRLEVAEVNNHELFARAGEHNFESKDIAEFANGGLIGNGIFSLFAHDVFLTSIPVYQFIGEEEMDGLRLLRFDFRVSQLTSGYHIGTNLGVAEVGYHGSFWADPKTLNAVRLDIIADDVPRYIGLTNASNRIDFATVRIGESDVLLPQGGELKTRQTSGAESRNQISFTHCREYGVQSVIRFDEVAESNDSSAASSGGGSLGLNYVELPSGVQLTLILETPIDGGTSHVGDLITAKVELDAKHKGKTVVPKDAVVSGRLRRMEVHQEGWPYILAGLEFTQIEFEGKQSRFFAELEKFVLPPAAPESNGSGLRIIEARDLPGVGVITVRGNRFRLPRGARLIWKTISYEQANKVDN
jgi:hypothetical protein